jgi:hypothetical protein
MFQKILATMMLLGKDIERGGEATQDAARDVQRKM